MLSRTNLLTEKGSLKNKSRASRISKVFDPLSATIKAAVRLLFKEGNIGKCNHTSHKDPQTHLDIVNISITFLF